MEFLKAFLVSSLKMSVLSYYFKRNVVKKTEND